MLDEELVDTSVWIDFLSGVEGRHVEALAALAISHDIALLHSDRDFDLIAKHCRLKTVLQKGS